MEIDGVEVESGLAVDPVVQKFEALLREEEALKRRLQNDDGPDGKQDKRRFRLTDIQTRLIPQLLKRQDSFNARL